MPRNGATGRCMGEAVWRIEKNCYFGTVKKPGKNISGGRLSILVTDTQELAGLGVVRSLGRAGYRVTAGHPFSVPPAAQYSRFCRGHIAYPDPWFRHAEFREWLKTVLSTGDYDAFLPIAEAPIAAAAALRTQLPSEVILILPSDEHLRFTLSKYHANRLARDTGVPVAPTVFVSDGTSAAWNDDLGFLRFPVVIKTDNVLISPEIYRKGTCTVVRDTSEARDVLAECRAMKRGVIAQEFVPGSGLGVAVLRWKDDIKLCFTHRRIHEVPWTGGASSFRASCHDPATEKHASAVLKAMGYQGVALVEFRQSRISSAAQKESGQTSYFMEINGRFWGSIALSQYAGFDFPAALLDCVLTGGIKPEREVRDYPDGLRCRNLCPGEVRHLFSVLKSDPQTGFSKPPSKLMALFDFFLLSLNPFIRSDEFWWTDPAPAFIQLLTTINDLRGGLRYRFQWLSRLLGDRRILKNAVREHRLRSKNQNHSFNPPSPCGAFRRGSAAPRRTARRGAWKLCISLRRQWSDSLMLGIGKRSPELALGFIPVIKKPKSFLFLCHGNMYRSPFAKAAWDRLTKERGGLSISDSAGFHPETGRSIPDNFHPLLKFMGIDMSSHRSRRITRAMADSADLILVMDLLNWRNCMKEFPAARKKILFLGLFSGDEDIQIPDPERMNVLEARKSFEKILRSVEGLLSFYLKDSAVQ